MLNTAVKAARKAGHLINKAILDPTKIQIMQKEKADYVTNIDKECEKEIINILTKAYPKHEIIAEESTEKGSINQVYSASLSSFFFKASLSVDSSATISCFG